MYKLDVLVQGYPGKSVCHGGLGWSTIALLRGEGRVILIDVGAFGVRKELEKQLAARGVAAGQVTDVVLTHAHYDHSVNYTLFPAATVWIGRASAARVRGVPLGFNPLPEHDPEAHLRAHPSRRQPPRWPSAVDGGKDRAEADETARLGRRLAAAGRALGEDGAAAATAAEAPAGLPQPAGAGPGGDGRHLLRAADGVPVERPGKDGHLLVVLGPPALPGVDRGRGVRGVLARGAAGLRRPARHRLDVAGAGRGDGQGPARRGKKPGPIRRTGASAG